MNKKSTKLKNTKGTAATVKGMAASSAEFIPTEINRNDTDFVNSLNEVFDYIPDLKSDKFH